jgi:hypothetical protein
MPVGVRYALFGLIDVSVRTGGGGTAGVTAAEAADTGPFPAEFVAYTVQVYGSPFVNGLTTIGLEALDAVPGVEPLIVDVQVAV